MEKKGCNPHVLILPNSAQGHINPILQFAKRLVSKGIKVTFVTTVYLSKSIHVDPETSIAMETISDGFDEIGPQNAGSIEACFSSFRINGSLTLAKLIEKFDDIGQPATALVYDGLLPWALDVAKQFGLFKVAFFTQSCAVNTIFYHVNRGLLQLPLSGSHVSIPEMPLLQPYETPLFFSGLESIPPGLLELVGNQFSNIDEADWILFNTFYELEEKIVDWMAKLWKVGTVGPTLPSMYLDKRLEDDKDYGIKLFKPKTSDCINWLNDKPSGSVVYVSFGSVADLRQEQMEELAWGLKGSNCYFMWVVRESMETKLPNKFLEETSDQGLVVSWCPQLEVLAHESIGCFVTHCGFNSVLEALSLGVPMVAMPQWVDQPTNAKFVEDVWGTGIRVLPDEKGIVESQVLQKCIKEIMEGEKGKEIKKNAKKWKELAKEAIDEGGSSDNNINEFVAKLLCS
ncbi:hypothetical protein ACOSP7_025271 [Xanthoceras sorbifolium]|uniref:Glycosyltransferase n=1 Tax=Xanthoceras sorbifolium TaxID=99658 RepID=A0ABQ8H7A1_9ROSI|nr:hypothetical protein JRO89_XS13G0083500 [Xanthoceras sorbifolium]